MVNAKLFCDPYVGVSELTLVENILGVSDLHQRDSIHDAICTASISLDIPASKQACHERTDHCPVLLQHQVVLLQKWSGRRVGSYGILHQEFQSSLPCPTSGDGRPPGQNRHSVKNTRSVTEPSAQPSLVTFPKDASVMTRMPAPSKSRGLKVNSKRGCILNFFKSTFALTKV